MTRRVRSGSTQKHKKMPGDATKWGKFDKVLPSNKKTPQNKPNFKQGFNSTCMSPNNVANEASSSFDNGKNFSEEHKIHVSEETKGLNKRIKLETHSSGEIQNNNVLLSPKLSSSSEEINCTKESPVLGVCSKKNKNKIMQLEGDINGNQDIEVSSNLKEDARCNSLSDKMESEQNIEIESKSFLKDDDVDVFNRKSKNDQSCDTQTKLSLKNDMKPHDSHIKQNNMQKEKKGNVKENSKDSLSEVKTQNLSVQVHQSKKEKYLKKLQNRRDKLGILLLPPKVERKLYRIKRTLKEKGLPPEALKEIMRKERRRAELQFRKEVYPSKSCFHCREAGHVFADCPKKSTSSKQETGICFKCGCPGHTSFKCPENVQGFPFATCFVCKEKGHISRDCSKNKHGVYPRGGRCKLCGNINHLKKDCPTLTKEKNDETDITLHIMNENASIDAEVMDKDEEKKNTQKMPKIIKF